MNATYTNNEESNYAGHYRESQLASDDILIERENESDANNDTVRLIASIRKGEREEGKPKSESNCHQIIDFSSCEGDNRNVQASPLLLQTIEEIRTKDGTMHTVPTREVVIGGPLSTEEEDRNLMQSSISGILKKQSINNKAQCYRLFGVAIGITLVIIGMFGVGTFLGYMSYTYWIR